MKIIGPTILKEHEGKIIHIHPSLLPKYPGKSGVLDALNAGETRIGSTVHYVDSGVDTGNIIQQVDFEIKNLNQEQIYQKMHEIEHELYIQEIKKITNEE